MVPKSSEENMPSSHGEGAITTVKLRQQLFAIACNDAEEAGRFLLTILSVTNLVNFINAGFVQHVLAASPTDPFVCTRAVMLVTGLIFHENT